MDRVPALLVALLLLLAGCTAPVARSADGPTTTTQADRADPRTDVQGWENGYWYDQSLDVNDSDGLSKAEREAIVSRAMARVERIRDVEFQRDVPVEVITREEYARQVTGGGSGGGNGGTGSGDGPTPAQTFRQTRYEALMIVGSSTDASEQEKQNDATTVQGYYSPAEDRIVIVSDSETPTIDEITLSQELFHAYQFRHLIPDRLHANPSQDRLTAWRSLIEGDANLVDDRYADRCRAGWNCIRPTGGAGGSGSDSADGGSGSGSGDSGDGSTKSGTRAGFNMGLYLLQYFPYSEGEQYVRTIQRRGGWDAVDAEYDHFPASTEQVIHRSDDPPAIVGVPAVESDEWSRVRRDRGRDSLRIGEAGIATMFANTYYDRGVEPVVSPTAFLNLENGSVNASNPLDYGIAPADGWAGDRMNVYRNPDGETAYVWRIRWDDAENATEFVDAYREMLVNRGATKRDDHRYRIPDGPYADAFYVERSGNVVTIINAPEEADLGALYAPAGS